MTELEVTKAIRAAILASEAQNALALIGAERSRLDIMTPFGTWLHVAAKTGCLEIVRGLVTMGADVNRRGGTFGGTAINLAASYGRLEVVELLLACGAELDVSEPERNPLFSAIQGGHTEIVHLLIEAGIDPNVRYSGQSMMDMDARAFANERGQRDIAAYLADL